MSGGFQEKLQQLRQEYTDLLPLRLKEIDMAWIAVRDNPDQGDTLRQMRAFVHTLAGSGATFGFAELSARASKLEGVIDDLIEDTKQLSRLEQPISEGIRSLHKAANHGAPPPETPTFTPQEEDETIQEVTLGKVIFWLGGDATYGRSVAAQLGWFNYQVPIYTDVDDFWEAFEKEKPDVVIVDKGDTEFPFPDAEEIMQRCSNKKVPSICVCPQGSGLAFWLKEIRSGATTCINRPVSLFQLLEKLDPLTFAWKEEPYRLFIIDDDVNLARNIATILTKAGMEVEVETNAVRVPDALAEFHPDLILIDLYMPECSGLELARLIRQDKRYLTVPIVYLSAETEINKRLEALEAGADDFILKPVKLRFLYHALSSRIKRARRLRDFYERDVLTGLYNHTTFQEELRTLLWQGIQNKSTLVVALIDLDRFKAINDHHGHQMGDQVLQTLAIKLKRRFGRSAIVARYDGASFVLAFPGADIDRVEKSMNEAREDFGHVDHEAEASVFEASFSCGLAHYPAYGNATDLLEACQKALIKAKAMGRNQVVALTDSGILSVPDVGGPVPLSPGETTDGLVFLEDDTADEVFLDDDDSFVGDELLEDVTENSLEVTEDDPIPTESAQWGKGRKIVVVDDDRQLLQVLTSFLTNQGFEVYGAPTGDEGYELVVEHHPSMVIIDLLLFPGIHGFELCKKIKTNGHLRGTRIILMTAVYKDYRYQVEGKEAGGDAFIIKPINFVELVEKMRPLLDGGSASG